MTTCQQIVHCTTHTEHHGSILTEAVCGIPLDEDGLCRFHDGPMCRVCSKPLLTQQERYWGLHSGCVEVPRKRADMPREAANALLAGDGHRKWRSKGEVWGELEQDRVEGLE